MSRSPGKRPPKTLVVELSDGKTAKYIHSPLATRAMWLAAVKALVVASLAITVYGYYLGTKTR